MTSENSAVVWLRTITFAGLALGALIFIVGIGILTSDTSGADTAVGAVIALYAGAGLFSFGAFAGLLYLIVVALITAIDEAVSEVRR